MALRSDISLVLVAVLASLVGAVATAQSIGRIAARDQLTISVFGVETLSGKFTVSAGGTITYPHLGDVRVGGLAPSDVEAELAKRLKEAGYLLNPQVAVELLQTPTRRVIVTGAVRSPGQFSYAGDLSLFEALARAGSTTEDAGDVVLVVRAADAGGNDPAPASTPADEEDVVEVSLSELERGNLAAHNVALRDGDTIVVRRAQQVFISGQVSRPGAYHVQGGSTVLQAIVLAGGLTDRGTYRGVRILRDGKEVKDITRDTVVEPGDTIIVKASPF